MVIPKNEVEEQEVSAQSVAPSESKPADEVDGKSAFSSNADDARKRVLTYMNKPPYSPAMVKDAILAIGNERGASIQSIIKWIYANYAIQDTSKLKIQIKRAVVKALDGGIIERAETSRGALGTVGCFVLSKTAPKSSIAKAKLKKQTKEQTRNKKDIESA